MRTSRRARRTATQLYRLCLVDGALDEGRTRLVVDHVIRSGRRGSLSILAHFERLVRLDRERHTARVVSAAPGGETLTGPSGQEPPPPRPTPSASVARRTPCPYRMNVRANSPWPRGFPGRGSASA